MQIKNILFFAILFCCLGSKSHCAENSEIGDGGFIDLSNHYILNCSNIQIIGTTLKATMANLADYQQVITASGQGRAVSNLSIAYPILFPGKGRFLTNLDVIFELVTKNARRESRAVKNGIATVAD